MRTQESGGAPDQNTAAKVDPATGIYGSAPDRGSTSQTSRVRGVVEFDLDRPHTLPAVVPGGVSVRVRLGNRRWLDPVELDRLVMATVPAGFVEITGAHPGAIQETVAWVRARHAEHHAAEARLQADLADRIESPSFGGGS